MKNKKVTILEFSICWVDLSLTERQKKIFQHTNSSSQPNQFKEKLVSVGWACIAHLSFCFEETLCRTFLPNFNYLL